MDPLGRVKEQLICAVCMETFRNPKMLPCLHSFCSICLHSLSHSSSNRLGSSNGISSLTQAGKDDKKGGDFECPTCREKVKISDLPKGIQSLPSNFWIVSMIDAVKQEERGGVADKRCDNCPEDEKDGARVHCGECDLHFCAVHAAAHAKSKSTRHHAVINLIPLPEPSSSSNESSLPHDATLTKPVSSPSSSVSDTAVIVAMGASSSLVLDSELSSSSAPACHTGAAEAGDQASSSSCCSSTLRASPAPSASLQPSFPQLSSSSSSPAPENALRNTPKPQYRCTEHPEEILKLICETCHIPICRDCALVEHREHEYSFLGKAGDIRKHELSQALAVTGKQIEAIQGQEAKINDLWNLVRANCNDTLLSIRAAFAEIRAALDAREQDFLVQVETSRQERLMLLHQHKEKLEGARALLQSAYQSSGEIHDQASEIELCMLQKTLVNRLQTLAQKIDVKVFETEYSKLTLPSAKLGRLNFVPSDSQNAKGAAKTLGKLTVASESLGSSDAARSLRYSTSKLQFKRLYDRLLTPVLRLGSPVADSALVDFTEPLVFMEPWGVAVSAKEEICVVDASRACVHIESPPANSVTRSISIPSDKCDPMPIGVIFDPYGNIVVTDQANNMVKILLASGRGCKGLGVEGSETCQFKRPAGIALDTRADCDGGAWIWIVDQGNGRVQAFGPQPSSWTYRQTCSGLTEPCAIAVDPTSHRIVITDTGARLHLLQRGPNDMKQTLQMKGYPNYDKDMPAATGIAIDEDGNAIVVDTFQNKIMVVRLSDGQVISYIGNNASFKAPRGICISPQGKLFISDQHRVQAF